MCRYVSFYIFSFCDRRLFLSLCIRLAPRGNKSEEGELLINSMYSHVYLYIHSFDFAISFLQVVVWNYRGLLRFMFFNLEKMLITIPKESSWKFRLYHRLVMHLC